jgi:mRNA interferase HigB
MKLVGIPIIEAFAAQHADVRTRLGAWVAEVKASSWRSSQDIKDKYKSASFLANNIVVFNIKGNSYRLVVQVSYRNNVVVVKQIGTHSEYSKWDL